MNGSLYLFPSKPHDSCDAELAISVLQALRIIAAPLTARVWQAGEDFAQHVVFAGCSPYLRFEPAEPGDTRFCHVALHGPDVKPRIITGQNTVKPRCPSCRTRLPDWQTRIAAEARPCPGCDTLLDAVDLDWRQHAAIGCLMVELRNVFPGEASPSDQLMQALNEASGFEWRYGWARQQG